MPVKMKRSAYADMFGTTKGDGVRLADTDIIIEVEKDFTTYGEEVKFGGGKVIRDGMGQSQVTNAKGAVDNPLAEPESAPQIAAEPAPSETMADATPSVVAETTPQIASEALAPVSSETPAISQPVPTEDKPAKAAAE